MAEITIVVNGQQQRLAGNTSLVQLIKKLAMDEPFAVAINQQFVPKEEYTQQQLREGDVIELLQPIVGG